MWVDQINTLLPSHHPSIYFKTFFQPHQIWMFCSCLWGNITRYFEPKHNLFLKLTKWLLCLNLNLTNKALSQHTLKHLRNIGQFQHICMTRKVQVKNTKDMKLTYNANFHSGDRVVYAHKISINTFARLTHLNGEFPHHLRKQRVLSDIKFAAGCEPNHVSGPALSCAEGQTPGLAPVAPSGFTHLRSCMRFK